MTPCAVAVAFEGPRYKTTRYDLVSADNQNTGDGKGGFKTLAEARTAGIKRLMQILENPATPHT